ncbi:hypothetical protein AVEN_197500-1 [Araneus ventricosus]|uniref:Uncharacterized protein n=1 Tax=Araneus ventricosus TaxID=182803 RepID=A0A4Y2BRI7_ARAVE|nr:hypothetical protein AVEN_197500-1 [Araneus ventricosus]
MLFGHSYHQVDTRTVVFRRAGYWSRCRANDVLSRTLCGAALWRPIVPSVGPLVRAEYNIAYSLIPNHNTIVIPSIASPPKTCD